MTDSNDEITTIPEQPKRIGGMTFETLAVSAFIFGVFAIVAAVFAIGMSARAVSVANGGGGGGGTATAPGGGGGGAATLDVGATEFAFDPSEMTVAENGKIVLTNNGTVQHDIAVKEDESFTMDLVDPGETGELDLSGLAPGEYYVFCTVPGHEAAGMKGTLTVG